MPSNPASSLLCLLFGLLLCLPAGSGLAAAGAPELQCPPGTASVVGRPASEIFAPGLRESGTARWCERLDERGAGVREGMYLDSYASGAPRTEARFIAGKLEGELRMRHENGRMRLRAHYRGGRLDGIYALFDEQARPLLRGQYSAGRPIRVPEILTAREPGGPALAGRPSSTPKSVGRAPAPARSAP